MAVTIQEILQNPNKIGELKAGHHGVYRIIRSVNVMDAPDIHNWLRSDQLLLTTGYVIKDDITAQKKLIMDLANLGCAGIAIKTQRFLKEIHPSVTALADQLDFPIIELPVDCHFSDIMDNVLSKIINSNDNMQHTLQVHHQLRQLILNGSDISVIANKLEDLMHCGIIFLDAKGAVIANSNRIPKKYPFIIAHIQQYIQNASLKRKMLQTIILVVNGKSFPIIVYPVLTRKMIRSYIILTELPEDTVQRYLTILEQAATMLTFEQMKKEAVLENERTKQLDFFSSCLEKSCLSNDDMLLGKTHGLIDAAYTCIIAHFPNKAIGKDLQNLLRDQLEQHILQEFPHTIVIEKKSEFIMLIPFQHHNTHGKENFMEAKLEQCLAELSNWLENVQSLPFKLGVGGRYPLLADLPKTFREAQEALISGYQSKVTPKIRYYKTKEVIELLRYIPQNKIEELYANTLGKFDLLKGQDREETLQTLFVYLENNCNIAETAKQLYIHRNTVLYRLEKCEELLDYSLKNPEKTLLLRIILRASELFTLSQ